jgi:FAD:protein FMN transferase
VLDPRAGQPAPELVSVTVVHPNAALADAAATALLVAGPVHWARVAQHMGLDQVLVIDRQGRRQVTPALSARLA